MATLESLLFSSLTTDPAVSAIVASRVYPQIAPQRAAMPLVTYSRVSGVRSMSVDGVGKLLQARYQIDCFANDYTTARALASAAMDALRAAAAFKVADITDRDQFEDEIDIHRIIIDATLWHQED